MSDLYGFWMSLFDHGEPEKLLLFAQNLQITLAATGRLKMEARIQYIRTILGEEALRQLD